MFENAQKIDRNKLFLCAYGHLFTQMLEHWEGDMALTVAKSLPAGLHLYNTVTGETLKA